MAAKAEWPKWLYGRDGGQIFHAPEDVPPGDWRDTPFKADPLDHDGDGKPGGSLPKAKRPYRRRTPK